MYPERLTEDQLCAYLVGRLGVKESEELTEYVKNNYNILANNIKSNYVTWVSIVKTNPSILLSLEDQPAEICEYAFSRNIENIEFIKKVTSAMAEKVAFEYPPLLIHVPAELRTKDLLKVYYRRHLATYDQFNILHLFKPEDVIAVINHE